MGESTSREVNGFVGWIVSFAAIAAYCLWALCTTQELERIGITYYPDRYWALALPTILFVLLAIVFFGYAFVNIAYAPAPDSPSLLSDVHARPPSGLTKRALHALAAASAAAALEMRERPASLGDRSGEAVMRQTRRALGERGAGSARRHPPEGRSDEEKEQQRRGAVSDLPLPLVNRVLYPLNPHLERAAEVSPLSSPAPARPSLPSSASPPRVPEAAAAAALLAGEEERPGRS